MFRIICLVITLYSSLAADVTVYNGLDYIYTDPQKLEPVAVSQFPWKFGYFMSDLFSMEIFIINKSPSVTAINVTYTTDNTVFKMKKYTLYGQEYYYTSVDTLFTAEIQIQLNLYSSKLVCSSFVVAKGRRVTKITNDPLMKEFPHYNCGGYGCSVVVDLVNKCVGPPLVTRTTMKPFSDVVNSNNKTLCNNVLNTSQYENIDTTTVKNAANAANADHTDYTNIIIAVISSIIGTLLILLLIAEIRERCWCKRSPSGTPQLPPHEPFYLNMLFRRECDQEIAEIDQHQYEEIIPRVTEGS